MVPFGVMGTIRHHAMVVTSYDGDALSVAHRTANALAAERGLDPCLISSVCLGTNGYRSFAIFPDGSKEGWQTSDAGDDLRNDLVTFLRGAGRVDWCLVQFGDEDGLDRLLTHSNDDDAEVGS